MRPGTVWTCSFLFLSTGKIYANAKPHSCVLNVKFKALNYGIWRTFLLLGKSVMWLSQIKLWLSLEFFAVTLLSLRFSTNCKLSCDSHFVWVSYAKAYYGNISQDFTHICQNFSLQNFWIVELCMKIWHLILFLLWCLIVAIKFYWEKDRTFRSLGWKCLQFFFFYKWTFLETTFVENKRHWWDNKGRNPSQVRPDRKFRFCLTAALRKTYKLQSTGKTRSERHKKHELWTLSYYPLRKEKYLFHSY